MSRYDPGFGRRMGSRSWQDTEGGYEQRYEITEQEHYRNVADIKKYLWWLVVIGSFVFLVFVCFVCALLYFAFELAAHRNTLEHIEEHTEEALEFLMEILNGTSEVTKDITTAYNHAKMSHKRETGQITDQEYNEYLQENGVSTDINLDDPLFSLDHVDESYATHFMHILMRALPLEDEVEMIKRFKNFFDGVDSTLFMLKEANRTRIVQNTSTLENNINLVLSSEKTKKIAQQGSRVASRALIHSDEFVERVKGTNHSIGKVLSRLNQLSKTPFIEAVLRNEHNLLVDVQHFGEGVYETLDSILSYARSQKGGKLVGNTQDIVDALNKFDTPKRVSQFIEMLLQIGSRTFDVDVEKNTKEDRSSSSTPEPKHKHSDSFNFMQDKKKQGGAVKLPAYENNPPRIVSVSKSRRQ